MPTKKIDADSEKLLYRSESDRLIAGVCGGIAAYFGIDSLLVRLFFILIILFGGSGLFIYLILWLVLPSESAAAHPAAPMDKPTDAKPRNMELKSRKNLMGVFLIGIGLVLLLQNFGFARFLYLDKTWPAILVILGLLVLSR